MMCRRKSIGGTIQGKLDWQPGLPSASAVLWEGSIEHVSCSFTSATTNSRSSNVPQSSCAPSSPRMEGICRWTSSDRVGVAAMWDGIVPLQTDIAPAPENLLRVTRCNCMADCSTNDAHARSTTLSALRLSKLPGIWLHEHTAYYTMWRWWRWWYCVLINVIRLIVSIVIICV